jgi:hypothetical protein
MNRARELTGAGKSLTASEIGQVELRPPGEIRWRPADRLQAQPSSDALVARSASLAGRLDLFQGNPVIRVLIWLCWIKARVIHAR